MFYGPYLITEVTHQITPGDFTTNFKGVRQGYFDFPQIDNFIQKINQNLLTKIEALIFQRAGKETLPKSQQQIEGSIIVNTASVQQAAEETCFNKRATQFENFITQPLLITEEPNQDFANKIQAKFPNNRALQTIIYILSYVRAYAKPGEQAANFVGANNNFADITLDKPLPGNIAKNIQPGVYTCKKVNTVEGTADLPAARFESVDKFLDFMGALLLPRVSQILDGFVIQYYCTEFPSSNVSTQYFNDNQARLEAKFKPIFEQAVTSAKKLGFQVNFPLEQLTGSTQNSSTTAQPICPTTTITSINPSDGRPNTIVTLDGTYMEYVRAVEIGGVPANLWTRVNPSTLQIISSERIKFSIPTIPSITTQTSLRIRLITTTSGPNGILAPETFNFIPV